MSDERRELLDRLEKVLAKVPRAAGAPDEEAMAAGAAAVATVRRKAPDDGIILMALTKEEAAEVRAWRAEDDARDDERDDVGRGHDQSDEVPASGRRAPSKGPPDLDLRRFAHIAQAGLRFAESIGLLDPLDRSAGRRASRPRSRG